MTLVALMVASVTAATLLVTPTPAEASRICFNYVYDCGQVVAAEQRVLIADSFCSSATDRLETQRLSCATERWLYPRTRSTEIFNDTDAFRAPAGCVTSYEIVSYWGGRKATENRRSKPAVWIKVHNTETAIVYEVSCQ